MTTITLVEQNLLMKTNHIMLIRTTWLMNHVSTHSVLKWLPLVQVIHGLFPQLVQGDQQDRGHPGDSTIKTQLWQVEHFFLIASNSIWQSFWLPATYYLVPIILGDSLMICSYLFTFGPDIDRPGCPGMPSWPGIPRSPCKMLSWQET